ncbi:glutaredoxin family protein [bacterium]|nr:glutaredoxin family protein [bacterium]
MEKKVRIYTISTCPYCKMLKEFLLQNNIQFEELNVGENREYFQEMMKKIDYPGVPVVEINGKIIVGFDKEEIKKELGI